MFMKVKKEAEKRTTVSIVEKRRLKLERLAIEATNEIGRTVKWTDIINQLIDVYSDEAKKDIVQKLKSE